MLKIRLKVRASLQYFETTIHHIKNRGSAFASLIFDGASQPNRTHYFITRVSGRRVHQLAGLSKEISIRDFFAISLSLHLK